MCMCMCVTLQVWSLQSVLPTALGTSETIRAQVLCKLRVVPGSAEPVQALRAVGGRRPALVVLGGQANEQPDALALLALPQVCVCVCICSCFVTVYMLQEMKCILLPSAIPSTCMPPCVLT